MTYSAEEILLLLRNGVAGLSSKLENIAKVLTKGTREREREHCSSQSQHIAPHSRLSRANGELAVRGLSTVWKKRALRRACVCVCVCV
jgi:hypothetical protein